MDCNVLYIVSFIGSVCLFGVFIKMKTGFGPFNLRAVGIVLVATFATLLAIAKPDSLNSAMSILGAIAGYLFGIREGNKKDKKDETKPDS